MPTLSCANEFAYCKSFSSEVIAAAMECGYLPMSCSLSRPAFGGMRYLLFLKNHHNRCVLELAHLKVTLSVACLLVNAAYVSAG